MLSTKISVVFVICFLLVILLPQFSFGQALYCSFSPLYSFDLSYESITPPVRKQHQIGSRYTLEYRHLFDVPLRTFGILGIDYHSGLTNVRDINGPAGLGLKRIKTEIISGHFGTGHMLKKTSLFEMFLMVYIGGGWVKEWAEYYTLKQNSFSDFSMLLGSELGIKLSTDIIERGIGIGVYCSGYLMNLKKTFRYEDLDFNRYAYNSDKPFVSIDIGIELIISRYGSYRLFYRQISYRDNNSSQIGFAFYVQFISGKAQ